MFALFVTLLLDRKEVDVLLRREISLKVICEKIKFSICVFFPNNFRDFQWTYIYTIQNILNDVQTKGKGG